MSTNPRMVPPYSPQGVCLASPRLVNRRQLRCAGEALAGPTPGVRGQAGRRASAEPGPSPAPARRVPRAPGTRPSPGRGRARRRSARGPRREPQPRARPSWTVPGPHPAELSPPPPGLPQTAGERLREAPAQPRRDRRRRPRASNSFWAGRATAPTHQRPAREGKLRAPSPAGPGAPRTRAAFPRAPARLHWASRHLGAPPEGRAAGSPPPDGVCTLSRGPTCRGGCPAAACPGCRLRLQ